MSEDETPSVLHLLPGDVLVLYSTQAVSEKRADEFRAILGKVLPEGAKMLVLGDGLKLGILRGLKPSPSEP